MRSNYSVTGQIVDVIQRQIFPGTVHVQKDVITHIEKLSFSESNIVESNFPSNYILPGFIDAHIHIESSMLTPYEFARKALIHGTVATVSDPHEIANVCGLEGVYYMIENAKQGRLKIRFGAPSCVPATSFETAGAHLGPKDVETLLMRDDIFYLSEMMNYPGVIHHDPEVLEKIAMARNARSDRRHYVR